MIWNTPLFVWFSMSLSPRSQKHIVGRPTDTVSKENEGKYFRIVACRCGPAAFI